jgi:glycosyltransferase involved in cell wall biosynthesis
MNVSVIIPCYNGEEFIGQAIGSVIEQSYPVYEIIVVDDGSTDRSAEIALNFGDPVKVLSKEGGGAANARNSGADYASGEALMFLDADDVLGPDVIKHLTAQLKQNPGGIAACPWFRLQIIENKWLKRPKSCFPLGDNQDHLSGWLSGWWHPPCSVLWSRTAFKKTGGWDPLAYVNDDGDLMMRALVDGINLEITDTGASYYRRMPSERVTETLSGAQFTRKGREAQIYVIEKIAQRLFERENLQGYRKPITYKLKKFRKLCMPDYPDLSATCHDLIKRYGEPLHNRFLQSTKNQFRSFVQSGMNKTSKLLSIRRLDRTRKTLKGIKHYISGTTMEEKSSQNDNQEAGAEITYGQRALRAAIKNENRGKIIPPENPAVSVIFIAAGSLSSKQRSMECILNQNHRDFEILVMIAPSKSEDKFLLKYADKSHIRFISIPENARISVAVNTGLREAKGEFIAFMAPGDEWFPNKLSKEIDLLQNSPDNVSLIYSDIRCIDATDEPFVFRPDLKNKSLQRLLLDDMEQTVSGITIHRNVTASAGFFDEKLPDMEYQDFIFRVARYHEFGYTEETLLKSYTLSVFEENSTKIESKIEARRMVIKKHRQNIKQEQSK